MNRNQRIGEPRRMFSGEAKLVHERSCLMREAMSLVRDWQLGGSNMEEAPALSIELEEIYRHIRPITAKIEECRDYQRSVYDGRLARQAGKNAHKWQPEPYVPDLTLG
jgi:hypothetical protein